MAKKRTARRGKRLKLLLESGDAIVALGKGYVVMRMRKGMGVRVIKGIRLDGAPPSVP